MPFSWTLALGGMILTLAGEALRFAAVRRIGVISRTRSERLGPLITSGPFAYVRNPLYIGNMFIWMGFSVTAGLAWAAPVVGVLLLAEYHAIVRWEERQIFSRYGEEYAIYCSAVSRWLPGPSAWHQTAPISRQRVPGTQIQSSVPGTGDIGFSWSETLFSERGTLIAIVVGYVLLWTKARF